MNGFLFDENVPGKITFITSLPVTPASDLGARVTDSVIWEHARQRRLAVVTKDADFSHRIMLAEPPPWVVRLRFGNLRQREFLDTLTLLWPRIEKLLPEYKLINVFADRIEALK